MCLPETDSAKVELVLQNRTEGNMEETKNSSCDGFQSTTSSYLLNVDSYCQSQIVPSFDTTTSSYLLNGDSFCADDLSDEWSEIGPNISLPLPKTVCVVEWMWGKRLLNSSSSGAVAKMYMFGASGPTVTTDKRVAPTNCASLIPASPSLEWSVSLVNETLPGCLCLEKESCTACTSLPLDQDLWSHLAQIKKSYQAKESAAKRKRFDDDEDDDDGLMVVIGGFRNMSLKKSTAVELSETFKRLRVDPQVRSTYVLSLSRNPCDATCTCDGCSARNDVFPAGNDECFARYDGCSARNDEDCAGNAVYGNLEVGSLMFLEPDGLPHGFSL